MISPKAVSMIIKHFDAVDLALSKRMIRKRAWGEPALTSLLCDLMDKDTQMEEELYYSIDQLNSDLAELDGLLKVRFDIETHEYSPRMERWVTQSDIGFILKFDDHLIPRGSWSIAWLLQAKRLYPYSTNPTLYNELSRFSTVDRNQHIRMGTLEKAVGCSFVRFLLYCARPSLIERETAIKLTHLRNKRLCDHIFDYTLGLKLHNELSLHDSSLAAGIFVTQSQELPPNLGHIHADILETSVPFSWFIASHLVNDGSRF